MILRVDLDGVVCSEESTFERALAQPVPGAKEALQRFHDEGHVIIIETARSWAEYKMTKVWLAQWMIYHDVLIMAKPIGDLCIDDRAVRFTNWQSIVGLVESYSRGYGVDFPSDEYFLMENRRTIFDFLNELANRDLPEPIIEVGPMQVEENPVLARFPQFAVDSRTLFSGKDFKTFGLAGKVDYKGDASMIGTIFPSNSIWTVIMMGVLEHITQPWRIAWQTYCALKPGGLLCLQVPWNLRFHGPRPDCWRFSDDGLHALFDQYFTFESLEMIETPSRMLMPICLKAVLRSKG